MNLPAHPPFVGRNGALRSHSDIWLGSFEREWSRLSARHPYVARRTTPAHAVYEARSADNPYEVAYELYFAHAMRKVGHASAANGRAA